MASTCKDGYPTEMLLKKKSAMTALVTMDQLLCPSAQWYSIVLLWRGWHRGFDACLFNTEYWYNTI